VTTYDRLRGEVADAARRLAAQGLLVGTAGNVSALVPGTDLVAVTATGVVLAECCDRDVTVVDRTGAVVAGELAPTSELDLHLSLYAASAAGAVVHTHAPYATAVACVHDVLPVLHYQQLLLGGEIRVAPYSTFGTPELAAAVTDSLQDRSAALMANKRRGQPRAEPGEGRRERPAPRVVLPAVRDRLGPGQPAHARRGAADRRDRRGPRP